MTGMHHYTWQTITLLKTQLVERQPTDEKISPKHISNKGLLFIAIFKRKNSKLHKTNNVLKN
jgi:hypothetical protein